MLDTFTKSKVEPPLKAHTPQPLSRPTWKNAWRIGYAIDDALKTAESERKALTSWVEDNDRVGGCRA
jgi:hypothetical protein